MSVALRARAFVHALPEDIPLPTNVDSGSDSVVSLEWRHWRLCRFWVHITETGELTYGCIDGTDSEHGTAQFDGATVPRRVVQGIRRIVEYMDKKRRGL